MDVREHVSFKVVFNVFHFIRDKVNCDHMNCERWHIYFLLIGKQWYTVIKPQIYM